MAGSFHDQESRMSQRDHIVEKWMLTIVKDGGIGRLDELHIDRIDDSWKTKDLWLAGGLEAYQIAVRLRDKHSLALSVVLAFSLEAGSKAQGVDFGTQAQLVERFDWTPPSLYLFHRGDEVGARVQKLLTEGSSNMQNTKVDDLAVEKLIGKALPVKRCYYIESKRRDSDEYSRCVYIEG
jgi:hypothetical protein